MAAANMTATHPTGNMVPAAPITTEEISEYERILKISEEIFSGSHPRLKVAPNFVRKPKTQPSEDSPTAQQAPKNQFEPASAQSSGPGDPSNPPSWNPTPTRVAPRSASDIDPLFLTKSDHLAKAELQLHRKRMERTLRDQWEQSKREAKQKPSLQDMKPDFDVSEVLDKARSIVKPVSLDPVIEANPRASVDDSYYSSKAPDSPPPTMDDQEMSSQAIPTGPTRRSTGAPVEQYTDELQRLEDLNRPGSDQEMHDAYSVADQHIPHPQKQVHPRQKETAPHVHQSQQTDNVEEPEYNPPSPVAPPTDNRSYRQAPAYSQSSQPYAERVREMPSGDNITVVRNHITSPAAPLPSRVSPLAVAKVPSVQQIRDDRFEHGVVRVDSDPESGRASPSGPVPQIGSRKRRKIQEKNQDAPGVSYKRTNADPSVPYIKEEQVSPPPFTDDFPITNAQRPAAHPVYIDIESPQYTPNAERHEPPAIRSLVYQPDQYQEYPPQQRTPISLSRVGTGRPVRDNTDLRRVASVQYARQPEYREGYIEHEPQTPRTVSYTSMDRRLPEQPRYYDVAYEPRYVQVTPAPQQVYEDQYYDEQPQAMAPPPRRYVIDEHGNEYEMVPSRRTQTMAPPSRPASRAPAPQSETYDDVPVRTASVRAPSVVQDPFVERRYIQEMPPPQSVYTRAPSRQYGQYGLVTGGRQVYYREPYTRASSVQVEYIPGRPSYVEEQQIPQEGVIRTSSVRPQAQPRYEEPQSVIQHVSSSHPPTPARAASVYMTDRNNAPFVPADYDERQRRYYRPEGLTEEEYFGGQIPLAGSNQSGHRLPQRGGYQGV